MEAHYAQRIKRAKCRDAHTNDTSSWSSYGRSNAQSHAGHDGPSGPDRAKEATCLLGHVCQAEVLVWGLTEVGDQVELKTKAGRREWSKKARELTCDEALVAKLVLQAWCCRPTDVLYFGHGFDAKAVGMLFDMLKAIYDLENHTRYSLGVHSLRDIMIRGSYKQAHLFTYVLQKFLVLNTTDKNAFSMLHLASASSAKELRAKALKTVATNLNSVIRSNTSGWFVSPLEMMIEVVKAASEIGSTSPFELFQHIIEWISVNPMSNQESQHVITRLLDCIQIDKMHMKELQYLLDQEPLLHGCKSCIEKLAGAYISLYMR